MKEKFTLFRRAAFLLLLAVTFGTLSVQAQELSATKSKVSALSKGDGFTVRKFQKSDPKASKISAQKMDDRRAKARAVRKAPDGATFFEDFEGITTDGELPEGWTAIDADGDGFNWSSHVNTGTSNHTTHSGDVSLYSESYNNDSKMALTPDNWLITPKVALGGTLKVWAIGQDANYCAEHFAFYVSVTGNTDVADFVQIAPASGEFVATGAYVEYIADLSAYAGREGYIAIRHFNVSDEFILVIDDFAIVDEVAPVTNLQVADVTSSQATVSWSGTYDSFNVRYRTAYDARATYFQDFEGDLEGWASYTENEGDGWELGSWGDEYGIVAYSESYSSSDGGLDVDNWLISPKLALGGTLKFSEYVSSSWPDSYEVLLSTTTDEKESFTITLREMAVGAGDWNEVSIDLSAYEGQEGYIAIHHVSNNCYYLIIDNFGIFGEASPAGEWVETTTTENSLILTGLNPETTYEVQVQGVTGETTTSWTDAVQFTTLVSGTPVPTNVTVTDITTDGATISWQGEADSYNVRYRSGEGEWTETTATEKSIALTGLENNVQYEVQVQAIYGELTSEWTEPVTFTTLKIFPKPSDFAVEDLTYNSAKLTWKANGDETGWQIYITEASAVSDIEDLLVPVDEPEYILTDLEEFTTYYVFLRAVYEDGVSDFFTSSFKTLEQFPTPKNFEYFGDVTFMSFGLLWDENANATGYEYIVSTTSLTEAQIEENAESAVATVEPYFYFTDGEPQTKYYVYFRTLYEDGVSSWVYPGFITTQKVPTPTNVAVSDIDSESAVVTWTSDEAIEQYKLRYRTKGVDPSGEETVALSENFDGLSAGSLPEGWTAIDADEDGYNWGASGDGTMVSDSFKNGVALSPDNWLITPKVQLDGLLKFNAKNSSSTYPDKMAVYVSTTGTDVEDFVEVLEPITPPTSWTEYTVDLRSFAGQEGYVAFRHSFVTDQLHIYIDDVSIVTYENSGTPAGKWVEIDASETTAELTELEAETDYEVQVQGFYHGFVSDWSNIVSFTTGDFFSLPTQITVSDITADAATVNWKNSKAENYFVQYRVAGEDPTVLFDEDFEGVIPEGDDYTYDLPEGWTTIDADGDGQSWYIFNSRERAHSGIAVATSASFLGGPLTPDNWLITPKVPLDGTLHAWFRGQDPSWSSEPYAIYVSTTGTEIADFTEVLPRTVATAEYVEQVVDLSEYAGQEGYVAFRHYDVTDMFRLNLEDVAIYKEVSENEWTYLYDYEEAPCTLTDLQPETKYEVRVGAVFYTREGEPIKIEGTNSVFFTTLAEEVDAIDDLAADVKAGRTDVYTLTGIRLKGMPTQRGFYIVNGKKIYVK
jgi:hypothetical protein